MNSTDAAQAYTRWPLTFLLFKAHPDTGCTTDQILLWHKAPVTTVSAVVTVVAHHEVMDGRNHPGAHRLPWLLIVSTELIACTWHGQNIVGHVTQCFLTLQQTDTVLRHAGRRRDLKETAAGFAAGCLTKGLHEVTRMAGIVSYRQSRTAILATVTRWLNGHFFAERIIGHTVTRQAH